MANKKQRALELAKTEARISGIPKGASTRTGLTGAEKTAYELASYLVGGIGAAKLLAKGVSKVGKLTQAAKARKLAKRERDTRTSVRQEREADNLIKEAKEYLNVLQSNLSPKSFLRLQKMPKAEQKKMFNRINMERELGGIDRAVREADRLLREVTKKSALKNKKPPTPKKKGGVVKKKVKKGYSKKYTNSGGVRKVQK